MDIFRIVLGGVLIAFGRRLYWLFVAGFGFLIGLRLAGGILQEAPQWLVLLLALAAGLVGALVAVTMQRFGIGLAGFLAGAYISYSLLDGFQIDAAGWTWIIYIVGGIAGAILLTVIFEWALILLSSIGGSVLAVQSLELGGAWNLILFVGLFVLGLVLQGALFKRRNTFSIT